MDFEAQLTEQLSKLNEDLNAVWNEVQENEELAATARSLQEQFQTVRNQLENGSLQSFLAQLMLCLFQTSLFLAQVQNTESGVQLKQTLDTIKDFYLNIAENQPPPPESGSSKDSRSTDSTTFDKMI